jgi:hypothetical protein
MKEDFLSAA